jgi:hypothetical protein
MCVAITGLTAWLRQFKDIVLREEEEEGEALLFSRIFYFAKMQRLVFRP